MRRKCYSSSKQQYCMCEGELVGVGDFQSKSKIVEGELATFELCEGAKQKSRALCVLTIVNM